MLLKNYIAKLKEQINEDNNTKINIHLPVFGSIKNDCVFLNKEISNITENKIDFSASGFMLPHITLYLGFVKSDNDYSMVCKTLNKFIQTVKPFTLSFSKPYLKNDENYVFLDVIENEKVFLLKKELYHKIKPYVKDLDWNVVNEPAHITIAHIKKNRKKVKKVCNKYFVKDKLNVSKINLSLVGNKGSCLGVLKEFISD